MVSEVAVDFRTSPETGWPHVIRRLPEFRWLQKRQPEVIFPESSDHLNIWILGCIMVWMQNVLHKVMCLNTPFLTIVAALEGWGSLKNWNLDGGCWSQGLALVGCSLAWFLSGPTACLLITVFNVTSHLLLPLPCFPYHDGLCPLKLCAKTKSPSLSVFMPTI